jgi:hypothetical protein
MLKNSLQMWNLLKILNKDKSLEGLKSIDDVYDSQVNVIEEILYYHNFKNKIDKNDDMLNQTESSRGSLNSSNINDMNDDVSPNIVNNNNAIYRDNKSSSIDD